MAETSAAVDLHEYLVSWICGGWAGTRRIRAPDPESAARELREHPSEYGLPHEHPIIGRVLRCVRIEPNDARVAH
jgi:hypothetical protein